MIRDARQALVRHFERRGIDLPGVNASRIVALMISWYQTERADDGAPLEEDGDGLLFHYGTYSFEGPATFQYGVTRQLIRYEDGEQCIWQLSLTLHYEPTPESKALEREIWCFSVDDVPAWRAATDASPATSHVARRDPLRVTLDFEQAC